MNNIEELCKNCYEMCKEAQFNSAWLFSKNGMSKKEIKKYAMKYMLDYLKISEEELKKVFLFFLDYNTRVTFENNKTIIDKMIELNFINENNLINVSWVENDLKNEIKRFSYVICEKYRWSAKLISEFCVESFINYEKFRSYASEYKNENASDEDKRRILDDIYDSKKEEARENKQANPAKYAILFNGILSVETDEEVAELINNSGLDTSHLKYRIFDYIITYSKDQQKEKQILEYKIDKFMKNLVEERKRSRELKKEQEHKLFVEQNIDKARFIISNFILSDYELIDEYCNNYNISKKEFYECLELIKENDLNLHSKYSKKQQELSSKRYAILVAKNRKIVDLMKNGIEEDGKIRDFDLVDYYERTQMDLNDFSNSLKGVLDASDYRALKIFIAKNKNDKEMTPFDISQLYKTKTIVEIEYDEKGIMIEGTGREFTKEEKQSIIFYLKSNNIPLTKRTYEIIKNRLILGNLDKDKIK